ncbi:hypothetical protein ACFLWH_01770 [Chloroflexota bacterium]
MEHDIEAKYDEKENIKMQWTNLNSLLTLLRRMRKDPGKYMVYITDSELPVPPPPCIRPESDELYDSREEPEEEPGFS